MYHFHGDNDEFPVDVNVQSNPMLWPFFLTVVTPKISRWYCKEDLHAGLAMTML